MKSLIYSVPFLVGSLLSPLTITAQTIPEGQFNPKLESIHLSRNATFKKHFESNKVETKESGALSFTILVTIPEGCITPPSCSIYGPGIDYNPSGQKRWEPRVNLDKCVDTSGTPLLMEPEVRWYNGDPRGIGEPQAADSSVGRITIEGKIVGRAFSRKVGKLQGILRLPISAVQQSELKPLSAYIGKPVSLWPGANLTLTKLANKTLFYELKGADLPVKVEVFSAKDDRLRTRSTSQSGGKDKSEGRMEFHDEVGSDIYVVASYPNAGEIKIHEIPFEFSNHALPEELP